MVDASGTSIALKQALEIVRPGGQVTKVGWGPQPLGFSLDPLVQKAVTLQGSFSHTFRNWEQVVRLLAAGPDQPRSHRQPRVAAGGVAATASTGCTAAATSRRCCSREAAMPRLSVFPKCYMDALCVTKTMTLFEWIDLAATLDVDGVEMYPGFFESFEPRLPRAREPRTSSARAWKRR